MQTPINTTTLTMKFNKSSITSKSLITIESPDTTRESPSVIALVLDTSGSMDSYAKIAGQEGSGLTVMDLLKHAIKTVITGCSEEHYMCLTTFSSKCIVRCPIVQTNKEGKQKLLDALNVIRADGATNLYDAIEKTWNFIASTSHDSTMKKSMILFTDGVPNMDPPIGYIQGINNQKEIHGGKFPSDISIFTYGNNVNSTLADQISTHTGGIFGFISDSSLIGDLIEHKIANIFTTRATNCILKIETDSTATNDISIEGFAYETHSWGYSIDIGDILYGQNRNIVIDSRNEILGCQLTYTGQEEGDNSTLEVDLDQVDFGSVNENEFEFHMIRQKSIDVINQIIESMNSNDSITANEVYSSFMDFVKDYTENTLLNALLYDFENQIKMAFSKQYYNMWGKHYLYSFKRSHQLEQCNNFKDASVQLYGGNFTKYIVDRLDDIFVKMPPPEPSKVCRRRSYVQCEKVDISQYSSRMNDACFHGSSFVTLHNRKNDFVRNLRKGDQIVLANGEIGEIECVVKTDITYNGENSGSKLVKINDDLHLTPYHPIKVYGKWVFPIDVEAACDSKLACNSVYSFILTEQSRMHKSGMIIGGIECATLGHGICDTSVIIHPFFGTERVINKLKMSPKYESGLIILEENAMLRDPDTELVFDIRM